jgi:P27 family predicted phage terminase small subunit
MARLHTPNSILKKRASRRTRDEEPESRKGKVEPTRELSPEAAQAFDRLAAELGAIGVLSPTFAELMTMTADAIGDIEIASRDLMARGHVSTHERGEIKNPSWTIKATAHGMALKGLVNLGLSPGSIAKLAGQKKEEENPFKALMS